MQCNVSVLITILLTILYIFYLLFSPDDLTHTVDQKRARQSGHDDECDELNHLNKHEAWKRLLHVRHGFVGSVRSCSEMILNMGVSVQLHAVGGEDGEEGLTSNKWRIRPLPQSAAIRFS